MEIIWKGLGRMFQTSACLLRGIQGDLTHHTGKELRGSLI